MVNESKRNTARLGILFCLRYVGRSLVIIFCLVLHYHQCDNKIVYCIIFSLFCHFWTMQRLYSINSLRPGDAYMRQSTNYHCFRWWVVAWSAPSHYQKQCWNIVDSYLWNKLQRNRKRNSNIFIQGNALENMAGAAILSRSQCVNSIWWEHT